ncbi:hypothetical protein M758_8G112400 [Ceratodon purpureus]|nr:hypothetical protein M758_8G112400 [Ceratodon purpureus]
MRVLADSVYSSHHAPLTASPRDSFDLRVESHFSPNDGTESTNLKDLIRIPTVLFDRLCAQRSDSRQAVPCKFKIASKS